MGLLTCFVVYLVQVQLHSSIMFAFQVKARELGELKGKSGSLTAIDLAVRPISRLCNGVCLTFNSLQCCRLRN